MEKIVEKVIAVPKPYPVKEFIEKKVQLCVSQIADQFYTFLVSGIRVVELHLNKFCLTELEW